jgi:hypothetical protein
MPTPCQPHANPMPAPCQPRANPMPTPCQPHANSIRPHANPMRPHANPMRPHANPMRPHSSGFPAGTPGRLAAGVWCVVCGVMAMSCGFCGFWFVRCVSAVCCWPVASGQWPVCCVCVLLPYALPALPALYVLGDTCRTCRCMSRAVRCTELQLQCRAADILHCRCRCRCHCPASGLCSWCSWILGPGYLIPRKASLVVRVRT